MANPITAIASRSCAKNTVLKQVDKPDEDKVVSTTVDVPVGQAGGTDIIGTRTDTTVNKPGSGGSTTYATEQIEQAKGGEQATDLDKYFKDLYSRFGNNVTTQELVDKKYISPSAAADYEKVTGSQNKGVATTVPGTGGSEETETEVAPDYETKKGMTTFDIRKDFRRQKIAERLAGKSDKQARRYAKRAERLKERGKTEKAKIFEDKSKYSAERAANLKDRLKQFKTQQDQGGFGSGDYDTVKVRQNLEDKKKQLEASNNPNIFTGTEPTDFQRFGKGLVKTAESVGQGIGDLTKPLGSVVEDILSGAKKRGPIKKNYFNK
jgi:hypothetical protein